MQATELVPSQILWIYIPSLSQLHWHPVSIAHVDLDDPKDPASDGLVTVHFKAYGLWTKVYKSALRAFPPFLNHPSTLGLEALTPRVGVADRGYPTMGGSVMLSLVSYSYTLCLKPSP